VLIELDQRKVQTAIFPEPRGPRSRIELLHASVTELDIMNFNLLPHEKIIIIKNKNQGTALVLKEPWETKQNRE
jgi:hypothetical protein